MSTLSECSEHFRSVWATSSSSGKPLEMEAGIGGVLPTQQVREKWCLICHRSSLNGFTDIDTSLADSLITCGMSSHNNSWPSFDTYYYWFHICMYVHCEEG